MRIRDVLSIVAFVIAAILVWHFASIRQVKRETEIAVRMEASIKYENDLKAAIDSLLVSFTPETVEVTNTVTRWLTLRDTLLDTLILTKRESIIVAQADTAIKACTVALNTCSILLQKKDSLITLKDNQIHLLERNKPSKIRTVSRDILIFLGGLGLGSLIK